jgi:hypothetical protein
MQNGMWMYNPASLGLEVKHGEFWRIYSIKKNYYERWNIMVGFLQFSIDNLQSDHPVSGIEH